MESNQVGVGLGVLIFKEGRFLLLQRIGSHGANTWAPPGGHIELGESFTETATRETKEETGLEIKNIRIIGVTNDFFDKEQKHYVTVWAVSDWASGEPRIMEPNKCIGMHWVTFGSLPSELFTSFKNFLDSEFLASAKVQPS